MSLGQIIKKKRVCLWLAILVVGFGGFGCATDEPDNVSSKPWNSPEGYQNGALPGIMQQPR
jgi:hypothetical protein